MKFRSSNCNFAKNHFISGNLHERYCRPTHGEYTRIDILRFRQRDCCRFAPDVTTQTSRIELLGAVEFRIGCVLHGFQHFQAPRGGVQDFVHSLGFARLQEIRTRQFRCEIVEGIYKAVDFRDLLQPEIKCSSACHEFRT